MAQNPLPIPMREPAVDVKTGKFTTSCIDWLLALTLLVSQAPARLVAQPVFAQAVSLPVTPLAAGLTGLGIYRISYYLRIVRAATTSSSVSVTISWTDGGVLCSRTSAALTSNVVTGIISETVLVRCDQAVALTYASTYASVGATTMEYDLEVVVEAVA